MDKNIVIKELNEYLKGEYMGIHAYEHDIKNTPDQNSITESSAKP